jgi:hypothetical protein
VAAGEIERVVVDQLRAVLRDPELVARTHRAAQGELTLAEARDALSNVDALWDALFPAEQARIVELLVDSIVVNEQGLLLNLRRNGLRALATEACGAEGDALIGPADAVMPLAIPMRFKRRGGRKEIIAPKDNQPALSAAPQEPLALALARGFHWQELLESGRFPSAGDLAKRMNVSKAYVTRLLRLTALAPDIVQAILDGREPSGLSLVKLKQPLPLAWEEQRRELGFPALAV